MKDVTKKLVVQTVNHWVNNLLNVQGHNPDFAQDLEILYQHDFITLSERDELQQQWKEKHEV